MAEPILVLDDDAAFRELVVEHLRAGGFDDVREAATAEDAITEARSRPPALAVLDVHLPQMSGYEVCRALRDALGPSLPIIFMSGERIDALDRVAGLLMGADDYLVKPFMGDELLARARRLLGMTTEPPKATAAAHG